MQRKNGKKKGFSLVELSIVIVIIGIILKMGLNLGPEIVDKSNRDKTKKILTDIESALVSYKRTYGHLPCPAARNLAISDQHFGDATTCITDVVTASTEGVIDVNSEATPNNVAIDAAHPYGSHKEIRIGMVPVKELGLPANYAFDAWGHKITYAAIRKLTLTGVTGSFNTYNDYDDYDYGLDLAAGGTDNGAPDTDASGAGDTNGVIQIQDENNANGLGNQMSAISAKAIVAYALVSHGRNGMGAFGNRASNNAVTTCTGTAPDAENCDDDAIFIDGQLFDIDGNANYFDDIVRWKTKDRFDQDVASDGTGSGGTVAADCPADTQATPYWNGTAWECNGGATGILGAYAAKYTPVAAQQLTTTYADLTGMTVSYTPRSSSSNIVVTFNFAAASDAGAAVYNNLYYRLVDSSDAIIGNAEGADSSYASSTGDYRVTASFVVPSNGTTARTFKLQGKERSGAGVKVHYSYVDGGTTGTARDASITVTEVGTVADTGAVATNLPTCAEGQSIAYIGGQWTCGNTSNILGAVVQNYTPSTAVTLNTTYSGAAIGGLEVDYASKSTASDLVISFDFNLTGTSNGMCVYYKLLKDDAFVTTDGGAATQKEGKICIPVTGGFGADLRQHVEFKLDSTDTSTHNYGLDIKYSTQPGKLHQTFTYSAAAVLTDATMKVIEVGAAIPNETPITTCSDGKVLESSGGTWSCGSDEDTNPAFRATTPTAIGALTTAFQKITWGSEASPGFDSGSDFASSIFTAPVAGKYLLTATANVTTHTAANSKVTIGICDSAGTAAEQEGSTLTNSPTGGTAVAVTGNVTVTALVNATAGGTYTACIKSSVAGGSLNADVNTPKYGASFSGTLVSTQ